MSTPTIPIHGIPTPKMSTLIRYINNVNSQNVNSSFFDNYVTHFLITKVTFEPFIVSKEQSVPYRLLLSKHA